MKIGWGEPGEGRVRGELGCEVLVAVLVALGGGACSSGPTFAEPTAETAPDDAIASFLTTGGMPAVAVAVVDGDQLV